MTAQILFKFLSNFCGFSYSLPGRMYREIHQGQLGRSGWSGFSYTQLVKKKFFFNFINLVKGNLERRLTHATLFKQKKIEAAAS